MGEMAAEPRTSMTCVRSCGSSVSELKKVKVTVRLLDERESNTGRARSMLETTRDRSSAERTKREAEAREHPITKHVLQTFGGHDQGDQDRCLTRRCLTSTP